MRQRNVSKAGRDGRYLSVQPLCRQTRPKSEDGPVKEEREVSVECAYIRRHE